MTATPTRPTAVRREPLHVLVTDTTAQLDALRPEWDALHRRDPAATAYHTWLVAVRSWQLEAGTATPFVITIRRADGTLVALLALALDTFRQGPVRLRKLRPLGGARFAHVGPIADPAFREQALSLLAARLAAAAEDIDEVDLRFVRSTEWLRDTPAPMRVRPTRVTAVQTVITPERRRWEELLSRSSRYNIRRAWRQLETDHDGRIDLINEPDAIIRWMTHFRNIHTTRTKSLGRTPYFELGDAPARFPATLCEYVAAGVAELLVVRSGERFIAGQIVLRHGAMAHSYRITFDEDFAAYSPGSILQAATLQRSIDRRDTHFDFGHGHESYKLRWGNERIATWQIHAGRGWRYRVGQTYVRAASTLRGRQAVPGPASTSDEEQDTGGGAVA